jgi:DNA-binding CsgD family transcriptional regulator
VRIGDTSREIGFFDFRTDAASATIYEASMRADPVYAIVRTIVNVVPASYWAYARVDPDGDLAGMLSSDGTDRALRQLTLERSVQRAKTKIGPRVAATLLPLGDFESGITLLFADAKTDLGILVLLRSPASGLFSSTEVGMLAFALDTVSDRLSALRLHLDGEANDERSFDPRADHVVAEAPPSAVYVLDREYTIVLEWQSQAQRVISSSGIRTRNDVRLPPLLEETVRDLTATWTDATAARSGLAYPVPFLSIRTTPLDGPIGRHIGVRIDRSRPSSSLSEAVRRYNISAREVQVLTLLLDGRRLEEIGSSLHITSSTVQDHIKSMVGKTDSRNRSELIAHVLGWEFAPEPR